MLRCRDESEIIYFLRSFPFQRGRWAQRANYKKRGMCYWLTFMIDSGLVEEGVTSFARDSGVCSNEMSSSPMAEILHVLCPPAFISFMLSSLSCDIPSLKSAVALCI